MNDRLILWPATRGPSLENEEEGATFAFEMNAAPLSACTQLLVSAAQEGLGWASVDDSDQAVKVTAEIYQPQQNAFFQWPATQGSGTGAGHTSHDPMLDAPDIEWPATRGQSLEEFIEAKHQDPRVFGGSSREEPAVVWPATRGPSLDDDFSKTNAFTMFPDPATLRTMPAVGSQTMQWMPLQGPLFNLDEFGRSAPSGNPGPLDELDFTQVKPQSVFKEFAASDASTADEETAMLTPPIGLSDDEGEKEYPDQSATLKISLTDSLGLWSVGSAGHHVGNCKPCAFLWKDPKQPGCENGRDCEFCHLCPPGEVKRRKKEKLMMRKMARNYRFQNHVSNGFQMHHPDQSLIASGFEGHYQNEFGAHIGTW